MRVEQFGHQIWWWGWWHKSLHVGTWYVRTSWTCAGLLWERLVSAHQGQCLFPALPAPGCSLPCTLCPSCSTQQGLGELLTDSSHSPFPPSFQRTMTGLDMKCDSFSLEGLILVGVKRNAFKLQTFRKARFYPFPVCSSSFWLFSAVAKSNIPNIQDGHIQQSHTQQLLKEATSLLLPSQLCGYTWGPFCFWKDSVLHIWGCAVPHKERNTFTASVRINIYQNSSVTTEQENYLKKKTAIKKLAKK